MTYEIVILRILRSRNRLRRVRVGVGVEVTQKSGDSAALLTMTVGKIVEVGVDRRR